MIRKILTLLSGNALASLLTLARNLAIAWLIPLSDYGIAATFAVAMGVVEMLSALGMEKQIVQNKRGEDPRFQAALQGFTLLRGALSAAVLFALSWPIAAFLRIPDLAWAYQVLALIPLIRAFGHFDVHRQQRALRFGPSIAVQAGSALAAVAAIWPAYAIWPDFRVMLVSLMVQALTAAAISHAMAERPWRVRFDAAEWRASVVFGWPLLANGVLLFAVMHGEKLVVGRIFDLEALAILAMGLTLTMTPTLILARSLQAFFLPQLSAVQHDDRAFQRLAEVAIQGVLAAMAVYLAGMVLLGPLLAATVLDARYAPLVPLVGWLAVQQGMRVLKGGGATVALARGQTANAMLANVARVAALPVAALVAARGGALIDVIAVATLGEAAGFVVSLALIRWRLRVSMRRLAPAFAGAGLVLAVAAGLSWRGLSATPDAVTLVAMPAAALVALAAMRQIRSYVVARRAAGFDDLKEPTP